MSERLHDWQDAGNGNGNELDDRIAIAPQAVCRRVRVHPDVESVSGRQSAFYAVDHTGSCPAGSQCRLILALADAGLWLDALQRVDRLVLGELPTWFEDDDE